MTQLYTAPTAIRTFMKWGVQEPEKHDLSRLRVTRQWASPSTLRRGCHHEHIGGERCPIVDT